MDDRSSRRASIVFTSFSIVLLRNKYKYKYKYEYKYKYKFKYLVFSSSAPTSMHLPHRTYFHAREFLPIAEMLWTYD